MKLILTALILCAILPAAVWSDVQKAERIFACSAFSTVDFGRRGIDPEIVTDPYEDLFFFVVRKDGNFVIRDRVYKRMITTQENFNFPFVASDRNGILILQQGHKDMFDTYYYITEVSQDGRRVNRSTCTTRFFLIKPANLQENQHNSVSLPSIFIFK